MILHFVIAVQQLRAVVHQLHQREATAILQPPYVRAGTGGIQERRHPVGVHQFWHGLTGLY